MSAVSTSARSAPACPPRGAPVTRRALGHVPRSREFCSKSRHGGNLQQPYSGAAPAPRVITPDSPIIPLDHRDGRSSFTRSIEPNRAIAAPRDAPTRRPRRENRGWTLAGPNVNPIEDGGWMVRRLPRTHLSQEGSYPAEGRCVRPGSADFALGVAAQPNLADGEFGFARPFRADGLEVRSLLIARAGGAAGRESRTASGEGRQRASRCPLLAMPMPQRVALSP